jgi:serine/threonine-protein kinase
MGLDGLLAFFGLGPKKPAAKPAATAKGGVRAAAPSAPTAADKAAEKARLRVRATRLRSKVDVWKRFEKLHSSISGTMSSFYKARERATGKVVGLKLLDPKKCAPIEGRYKGLNKPPEGEIGDLILGPNLVRTIDWGVSTEDAAFIVEEFIEGPLLHAIISKKEPLPPHQRLDLVRQAATALECVHQAGFVHRDICPRNFILDPDGRLVLFDFGLTVPDRPVFLQPGNRIGTPNYMAPEVVRRRQADKRIDIFSLGITAYEICTLTLPWPRGTTGRTALAHDTILPDDIRNHWADIPPPLADAIMACIAADPDKRPAGCEDFLAKIAKVSID